MDAYLGLIFPFAGTFAPQGTVQCWGQDMPQAQNQALYALISTMYGGNTANFKVPDLRGRVLMGAGASPYLANVNVNVAVGSSGGAATSSLNLTNLPLHTHNATFAPGGGGSTSSINANVLIPISTAQGNLAAPASGTNYLGGVKVSDAVNLTDWQTEGPYTTSPAVSGANLVGTASGTVTVTGGGGGTVTVSPGGGQASPVAFTNLQPYLAVTMYIVTMGLFPNRD